ncbi:hypothetical protein GM3708_2500 [Geminocystis sp. NIES-3708]|uniref:DUF1822 family protein n=1 Tax=Geminocystis sp. NIES-3708 TaxID=1615909 RepID=UPI0005FC6DC6|nr:DUF1822 family protein [Geminocystis sp. NIES-3708]BAQ62094.1 hypothetical protein GM3708_2500 [Geminocystis sp. NIES-3708]
MTNLIFFDTPIDQIKIQLTDKIKTETWQNINQLSNDIALVRGYLNLLVRKIFISWLNLILEKNFSDTMKLEDNLSIWEFINGNAIDIDSSRIILIPIETQDKIEFSIPEEWLKIPQWVGNYYIAVEVNLEENYLNFAGYISYEDVNNYGKLDSFNHCYDLPYECLETDLNLICLEYEYGWDSIPQILPLPFLSSPIKQNLFKEIQDNLSSCLLVNFGHWLSLLSDNKTRYQLFASRKSVNLSEWLKGKFLTNLSKGWQTLDMLTQQYINFDFSLNPVFSSRSFSFTDSLNILQKNIDKDQINKILNNIINLDIDNELKIDIIKILPNLINDNDEEIRWNAALALQKLDDNHPSCAIWQGKIINLDSKQLSLLIGVLEKSSTEIDIFIRLFNLNKNYNLPEDLRLQIIDQNNNIFANLMANDNDRILQYKFWGNTEEKFIIKVILNNNYFEEKFNI